MVEDRGRQRHQTGEEGFGGCVETGARLGEKAGGKAGGTTTRVENWGPSDSELNPKKKKRKERRVKRCVHFRRTNKPCPSCRGKKPCGRKKKGPKVRRDPIGLTGAKPTKRKTEERGS